MNTGGPCARGVCAHMWSFQWEQHALLRKYFQVPDEGPAMGQCWLCFLIHKENDCTLEDVNDIFPIGLLKSTQLPCLFFISLGAFLFLSIRKGHFLFLFHSEKTDFSLPLVCPQRHWCRCKFPNCRSEAGSGL